MEMINPNFVGKCGMCRWYRNGLCLKKPPTVFKIDGIEGHHYYDTIWPYVEKDDYCAEFVLLEKTEET